MLRSVNIKLWFYISKIDMCSPRGNFSQLSWINACQYQWYAILNFTHINIQWCDVRGVAKSMPSLLCRLSRYCQGYCNLFLSAVLLRELGKFRSKMIESCGRLSSNNLCFLSRLRSLIIFDTWNDWRRLFLRFMSDFNFPLLRIKSTRIRLHNLWLFDFSPCFN